jgi:hypothetical protein
MAGQYKIVTAGGLRGIMGGMDELTALDAVSGGMDPDMARLLASSGYTGIMGDDPMAGAQAAMVQQMLARNSVLTQEQDPTKAREYPLGFVSAAAVAAGASVDIIAQPQVVFRGERLIVPSDIAGGFVIDDIKVGKNSQFASSGAVPARTFDEQGVGVRLRLDTAQISQQIVLSVTNIGGAPAIFRATLIGTAVE